ncbi:hypothetical protein O6H91_04G073300 [Diphasiastrum complanatum]|uniref:Uncharacterized protein n=5 Tax=Diphasiastrum complanatum TaxID=34168 RepID=A0ACC2DY58_DIPCM|nr:hypothetical protein O6H91_04G014900 [Diphasiastrum complanatum]KAJ7557906.1 hypothetical protein O6H91_04G014900 [Diphasiastrum complanatum]KAJ7559186.1 hypothetical protein O6H91_04G073300 [Diphasiastrum complanatum]KAJ7559187.1 hypothetical protein O6H91_04G073300 [Diphasiastrum complanatum]KAJ7559188.1 hypothetical protein O6H91_04G073300 [Diphasiastrum complanatum]
MASGVKAEVIGVKFFCDGTVDRSQHDQLIPTVPPSPSIATAGAFSKDVPFDSSIGVWGRVYLPESVFSCCESDDGNAGRLPVILYFHGGGFVMCSAAQVIFHEYCCKLAARIRAMVISVEYRRAPEHKLPAAFDDGFLALKWLQGQHDDVGVKDPWLSSHADLSKCILMGHSAGATIVHHVALKAAAARSGHLQFIRGLILGVPFFGGIARTSSEIKYAESDELVTLELTDTLWALSLPHEADRSHPYCSFVPAENPDLLKTIQWPPSLVVAGALDPLHDRQIELVEFIRKEGQQVILKEYPYYNHNFLFPEVRRPEDVDEAYMIIQRFLAECFQQR